ncbi:MAG: hypothetical protein LBP96_05625 [Bacteroidales bacterium]|nr:hypothetical protein [Bacteroidales bacterium]
MATRLRRNGTVVKVMPLESLATNSNTATSPSRRGVMRKRSHAVETKHKTNKKIEK